MFLQIEVNESMVKLWRKV